MKKWLLKKLIQISGQNILFPFYHEISDKTPLHLKHLYQPKKIKDFEKDIQTFLNYYDPISLPDFLALIQSKKKNKNRYFLLSFDDGFQSIYENAFPVLNQYDIKPIVFLNPDFVDNQDLMFRLKASLLVENYSNGSDSIREKYHQILATENVKQTLLKIHFSNRITLDQIATKIDYSFAGYLKQEKPYLSTVQIKELQKLGWHFGGHSMNHPYFSRLSLDEQIQQATQSVEWVREKFNIKEKTFAFPFSDDGITDAFFDQTNFNCSFGTGKIKIDSASTHFQRLGFEKEIGDAENTLWKEYRNYLIKIGLQKHKTKR